MALRASGGELRPVHTRRVLRETRDALALSSPSCPQRYVPGGTGVWSMYVNGSRTNSATGPPTAFGTDLHLELHGPGLRAGLTDALREAVRTGRLAPGNRLPSSRSLAADLGVSRN